MNQQFAKILVAAFADACQSGPAACRHLPWYQAKPGGKVSPPCERDRVADRSNQGSCVQHPDARDGRQASGSFVCSGLSGELIIKLLNAAVQLAPLGPHILEQ